MAARQPPLNWETSTSNEPQVISALPPDVITCLKNARFLHLATCSDNMPHISLMNYTYLPSNPFSPSSPIIIMTMNPSSRKTINLISNPRVSLCVHDWVSHRPPTAARDPERSGSPPPSASARSSLAEMLLQMNTSNLGKISVTINGEARVLDEGGEEERWAKERHLENHTFREGEEDGGMWSRPDEQASLLGTSPEAMRGTEGNEDRSRFMEGQAVSVVVVRIRDGRVADYKGGVRDWVLSEGGTQPVTINGVR